MQRHSLLLLMGLGLAGCARTEPPAPVEIGPGRPEYQLKGLYRGANEPLVLSESARSSVQDDAKGIEDTAAHFIYPIASRDIVRNPPPSAENGLNFRAAEGELFWAAAGGSVIYAGFDSELGNTIIIRHSDEWVSIYAHAQRILVKTGQVVSQKQSLGKVGKTGQVDRPMLHFEMRQESKNVNPVDFLK